MNSNAIHGAVNPCKCKKCGRKFEEERVFDENGKKYAGEKPHKCRECPKKFNHVTDLGRHECLHTGEKRPTYVPPPSQYNLRSV